MNERRWATRYPVQVPLDVEGVPATTRDISRRGLYFHCDQSIAVGTRLELDLPLEVLGADSAGRVRVSAEVIRVEPQQDGRVGVAAHCTGFFLID